MHGMNESLVTFFETKFHQKKSKINQGINKNFSLLEVFAQVSRLSGVGMPSGKLITYPLTHLF